MPDPIIICIRLHEISETPSKVCLLSLALCYLILELQEFSRMLERHYPMQEDSRSVSVLAAQLAHQFPSSPVAPVALAHALYRQLMACSTAPSTHQERMLVIQARLSCSSSHNISTHSGPLSAGFRC